ncbi:MAG: ABC transporter permease [Bowdeniella nasicola]|nr:ABC transporter permease [Bowdeniella nasicola]
MIRAQAWWELRALLRNGEQLLVTFLLPILALVVLLEFTALNIGSPRTTVALAGCLAMGVIAAAFTSQAIMIAFDRRWGVLRMLSTTPLGPRGLLWGKAIAVVVLLALQITLLLLVATWRGAWQPPPMASMITAIVVIGLGALSFVACAMALGGTLRAEAVLAFANIAFVLMVSAGGVLLPLGDSLGAVLMRYTPWGALGEGLREALLGNIPVVEMVVQAAWALVLGMVAMRVFRWRS